MRKFADLGISPNILTAIAELGYEEPSPIQSQSIPLLLQGRDLLAEAQTGTGKTAAFAIPVLMQLELAPKSTKPQALILAPTRELAIQVAEAFKSYAKYMPGFHVLPIYGGQDYQRQLSALKRGVHVVVGTPGRIMDHLRRGTLVIEDVRCVVLDEADEMLRMGFIEDVQWILSQIKTDHQSAFFSATIPQSIKNIADKYLKNPARVHIEKKFTAVESVEQFYLMVSRKHKMEALSRILEVEQVDAALIFTRTKTGSSEVAEKLEARGYAATALNGDMSQSARERVITRIKNRQIDFIVATEVAARGLDIDRISHVINYDIPQAVESYVHRIGRTGRAGRKGRALLFVAPTEMRMLKDIEKVLRKPMQLIQPPSAEQINQQRSETFMAEVIKLLAKGRLDSYRHLVEQIMHQSDYSEIDIAAALACLAQKGKTPFVAKNDVETFTESDRPSKSSSPRRRSSQAPRRSSAPRGDNARGFEQPRSKSKSKSYAGSKPKSKSRKDARSEKPFSKGKRKPGPKRG